MRIRQEAEETDSGIVRNRKSPGTAENGKGTVQKDDKTTQNKKNSWKQPDKKLKFTFKEQKDYQVIEEEIAGLEEKISNLEQRITEAATDFVKLNQLTEEKEQREQELEEKMNRWMYLEDLKARIDAQKG